MKRVIMAAALALLPAVAFAQDSNFEAPTVPQLSLVPTLYEMELLREQRQARELIEVQRTLPKYRAPIGGDWERELMWATSPFGSPVPAISLFRF
jgi:hypothetical protein